MAEEKEDMAGTPWNSGGMIRGGCLQGLAGGHISRETLEIAGVQNPSTLSLSLLAFALTFFKAEMLRHPRMAGCADSLCVS
jgi:hypothetical protein